MTAAAQRLLPILLILLATSLSQGFNHLTQRVLGGVKVCRTSSNDQTTRLLMSYDVENETKRQLYNIKNSSWKSNEWNWGYARGTGHDCASICRRRWSDKADRKKLVDALLNPEAYHSKHKSYEVPFEEVKLILGLLWQRAGRSHAFNEVLENMVDAKRYELDDEVLSALNFVTDVRDAFPDVALKKSHVDHMNAVAGEILHYHDHMVDRVEAFRIRRVCAGMVLEDMGFIENGI